jgi:hypothetical protein
MSNGTLFSGVGEGKKKRVNRSMDYRPIVQGEWERTQILEKRLNALMAFSGTEKNYHEAITACHLRSGVLIFP